jgi:hypothetical protein
MYTPYFGVFGGMNTPYFGVFRGMYTLYFGVFGGMYVSAHFNVVGLLLSVFAEFSITKIKNIIKSVSIK